MTTIYDVARLAEVSPATVSRVLNGRGEVNDEMTRRVRESVRILGYRPNGVARNLRRNVAAVWALIISDIENSHFTSLVRGVEDVARANGHSVVLCNSDEQFERERAYIDVALDERMAGVVISPSSDRGSALGPLLDAGVPVVSIDRKVERSPVSSVVVDNEAGAREATRHLVHSGYRRIGCVTGPGGISTAAQRLAGYRNALTEAALPYDRRLVAGGDFREAGGAEAVRALLARHSPPDALFVANGLMAMGAVATLSDAGMRVPDDMGLVCFDDMPWARLLRPGLSCVAQPTYDIGRTAAEMLLDRTARPDEPPRRVILPTRLVIRGSSRR